MSSSIDGDSVSNNQELVRNGIDDDNGTHDNTDFSQAINDNAGASMPMDVDLVGVGATGSVVDSFDSLPGSVSHGIIDPINRAPIAEVFADSASVMSTSQASGVSASVSVSVSKKSTTSRRSIADKPCCNWCFTWNNPPEEYRAFIDGLFQDASKHLVYLCYGRETGESGTFHLQGFLQLHHDHPLKLTGEEGGPKEVFFQAHWTKARSMIAARKYCFKDDPNPVELGKFRKRAHSSNEQGKRSDLEEFQNAVRESSGGMTMARAREEFPEVAARYPRYAADYIADNKETSPVENHTLYAWQRCLLDKLTNYTASDREVIFIIDYIGNGGKTYFSKWFINKYENAQIMNPGKVADMAYAMDETCKVLFIDCPRSRHELFQYDFVEYVKNGLVFSTKYESRMKKLGRIHVVVFMNEDPDPSKLSSDRYTIIRLDDTLKSVPPSTETAVAAGEQTDPPPLVGPERDPEELSVSVAAAVDDVDSTGASVGIQEQSVTVEQAADGGGGSQNVPHTDDPLTTWNHLVQYSEEHRNDPMIAMFRQLEPQLQTRTVDTYRNFFDRSNGQRPFYNRG